MNYIINTGLTLKAKDANANQWRGSNVLPGESLAEKYTREQLMPIFPFSSSASWLLQHSLFWQYNSVVAARRVLFYSVDEGLVGNIDDVSLDDSSFSGVVVTIGAFLSCCIITPPTPTPCWSTALDISNSLGTKLCIHTGEAGFIVVVSIVVVNIVEVTERYRCLWANSIAAPSASAASSSASLSSHNNAFLRRMNSGLSVGRHALTILNSASTVDQIHDGPSSAYWYVW